MGQLWLIKHDKPVLVLFTQHHINTAFILWILLTSILSHFSPSICFLPCFSLPSLGLVTCFPHLELLLLWQTHSKCNTQGWKAESLPTKIWYKTRMFTLTTSLHHSIGSPRHSNQTRIRNKRYPNWKGRGKIVTLCKWNHRTASVVSLCICDSHSPSCLFFQISHATDPVVEDLFLYLVEFGIFWQNVFPSLVYCLLPISIFSSALPAIPTGERKLHWQQPSHALFSVKQPLPSPWPLLLPFPNLPWLQGFGDIKSDLLS